MDAPLALQVLAAIALLLSHAVRAPTPRTLDARESHLAHDRADFRCGDSVGALAAR